jgi:hypothetical protein
LSRTAYLAAALMICASAGIATQANAGLSLADPTVAESYAAARKAEVAIPQKATAPVRQKAKAAKVRNTVALTPQRAVLRFPLLLGVAY